MEINLPSYEIKLREKSGKREIFDFLRRRYVALTPEEWVRQHFVHFLVEHKGYPKGLLANELELRVGEKRLRCDTLLYNNVLQPKMISSTRLLIFPSRNESLTRLRPTTCCCM